jgi:hypothetical protein
LDARLTNLLCKRIIVAKSKKSENWMVQQKINLAEFSEEGHG